MHTGEAGDSIASRHRISQTSPPFASVVLPQGRYARPSASTGVVALNHEG
jgi:hypothetical protein